MGSIPEQVDDYIKKSIDRIVGLQVPSETLQLNIQSLEAANYRLRDQYLGVQLKLKKKDDALELARAEACMNAQALKKFVGENQKLRNEYESLVNQFSTWERECALYDRDREVLIEFGKEADGRAKEAENRIHELEEELRRVSEEAVFYRSERAAPSDESSVEGTSLEQSLLEGLVASLVNKDEVTRTAHDFLEANNGAEPCHKLLKMWNGLTPATQNVLSLTAQVRILQKDKERLRINLHRAEKEAKLLSEENRVLDEKYKSLWRQCNCGRKHLTSGGKHKSSAATKSKKRKSSPELSSSAERRNGFGDMDSLRYGEEAEENKNSWRQYNYERKHLASRGKHRSSAASKSKKRKYSPELSSPVERWNGFRDTDSQRYRDEDEENKSLWRQYNCERKHLASGGKHRSSAATKSKKRKSSTELSSPAERRNDFGYMDSRRRPLSSLKENTPESRMYNKQGTAKTERRFHRLH